LITASFGAPGAGMVASSVRGQPVLFTQPGSVYESLGCDCYPATRDARNYRGVAPVVAHPPCRLWGRLSKFSKAPVEELELGRFAVDLVRRVGGVVEHPEASRLFDGFPRGGRMDSYGGWVHVVDQYWFGHRARKRSLLYIVGVRPGELPAYPLIFGRPPQPVENMNSAERDRTPRMFAIWLLDLAYGCNGERVAA
jgi:hypothetical protein